MIKYILLGVLIFLGFQINPAIGILTLFVAVVYILYMNTPTFYSINGNIAINEGNLEEALEYYKKAYKTGRSSVSINLSYAILLLRNGYAEEAMSVFNQIVFSPTAKPAVKYQAKQYRVLAYYKLGNVEDAMEDAEELFENYKNTISYGLLGYLKLATNAPLDEVVKFCEEAYEYNSDDRDIVDNLAFAYIKQGEYEKAKKLIDTMLEDFPTFTEAYYHGAVVYKKLGDYDKARELLDAIEDKCRRTYLTTVSLEEIEDLKNSLNWLER